MIADEGKYICKIDIYLLNSLQKKLAERAANNSLRKLQIAAGSKDFCSNDYLGIATNRLIKLDDSLNHGSTGSRLLAGNNLLTEETEQVIASFHRVEGALIFNSGYDANIGLLSCIAEKGDTIIYDQLSHASIRDGVRLSRAQSFSFLHNDPDDLEKKIRHGKGNLFVVTESVFSMDGDQAPLKRLIEICDQYNANLIVDEAHALGIIGAKGEGLLQQMGLSDKCFARIVTFGKACGVHGAAVLASSELRDYLINFARSFIYTTALPPSSIAAIKNSYELLPKLIEERKHLNQLIKCMQEGVKGIQPSVTAIQVMIIPGNKAVKKVAVSLQNEGFDIRPILYPTVARGSERLRIVLHSFNKTEDVKKLISLLNDLRN